VKNRRSFPSPIGAGGRAPAGIQLLPNPQTLVAAKALVLASAGDERTGDSCGAQAPCIIHTSWSLQKSCNHVKIGCGCKGWISGRAPKKNVIWNRRLSGIGNATTNAADLRSRGHGRKQHDST
jgi:hypothetical protein